MSSFISSTYNLIFQTKENGVFIKLREIVSHDTLFFQVISVKYSHEKRHRKRLKQIKPHIFTGPRNITHGTAIRN